MRWASFILLAYVLLGLQIGLGGIARVGAGQINFVLIAATFIAINAQREPALIGCFLLGLLHDLVGFAPIGTYALAYSALALLVAGTERSLSVEHPFTHFFVTLFGGIVVAIVLLVHGHFSLYGEPVPFWGSLSGAFFTALVALPILWGLTRLRRSFRFRTSVGR